MAPKKRVSGYYLPCLSGRQSYNPYDASEFGPLEGDNTGQQPATVVLADGSVLFVGGGPAQLFDPIANDIDETIAQPFGNHGGLTATLLLDGTVLVVGCGLESRAVAEIYEPRQDRWRVTDEPSMHSRWLGHAAPLLPDGRRRLGREHFSN